MKLREVQCCFRKGLFYTCAYRNFTILLFFSNLGIVPATQTFFLYFYWPRKLTTFISVFMTKPLFDQNVFGLTLVRCIIFIANFFCLAPCWKFSKYWSQPILFQTYSYHKKCWNYNQPWCLCCFLCVVMKLKSKMFHSNVKNVKQFSKENAYKVIWKF